MRTHIEFQSSAFTEYQGEEQETNPDRHGKRLAEYLHSSLANQGYETQEIYSEVKKVRLEKGFSLRFVKTGKPPLKKQSLLVFESFRLDLGWYTERIDKN